MQKIDLTCPKCGANMQPNEFREEAVCEYCGYHLLLEKEATVEEIAAKEQAKSYGYHKGKLKAEEEAEKTKKYRGIKIAGILLGVVVLLSLISLFTTEMSKPEINPFTYIQVSFQGTDGKGEVVVEALEMSDKIDINYVDFEISKEKHLLQGETITINATSDDYRLTEITRTYKVEGLDEYLKDLTVLSEDALEVIHVRAEAALKLNLESSKDSGHFIEMKPVKLFLATDGKQTNRLYDVFEARFTTNDGEKILYVMAYFDNVIIRSNEQSTVNISGGMYLGHITQVQGWLHIMAYDSLEEIRAELISSQEGDMELKELDL